MVEDTGRVWDGGEKNRETQRRLLFLKGDTARKNEGVSSRNDWESCFSPLEGIGVRFWALALGSKHVGGETSGSGTARCRWNRGAVLYERYPIIPTKIFPEILVVFFLANFWTAVSLGQYDKNRTKPSVGETRLSPSVFDGTPSFFCAVSARQDTVVFCTSPPLPHHSLPSPPLVDLISCM